MRRLPLLIALGVSAVCLSTLSTAQNIITISSCPGADSLPVSFQVDCSHVADPSTRTLCRPFAENQACKVFPAYRKLTGIRLEESCLVFKYTIYDKDAWPHQNTSDGGFAGRCGAEILTDFSLENSSDIGPVDVHEILHVYQQALGAVPYQHILFGPSMTEARHMIGDNKGYAAEFVRMKQEFNREKADYETGKIKVIGDPCVQAELYEEDLLYMQDHKNVELFYTTLQRGFLKDQVDREARFNRMYDTVSRGEARSFLLAHGCGPF